GASCLLERTYRRVKYLGGEEAPYIVAAKDQLPLVLSHCGEEITEDRVIGEPVSRNTAAAIYWSALKIQKKLGDVVLAVFPADHQISDEVKFRETMSAATAVCEKTGTIVVIGVKPRYIATGFGYVERGKSVYEDELHYYKVRRFVEKPHREKARRYLKKGTYYWNSGIFVLPLPEIFDLYNSHLPDFKELFAPAAAAIGTEKEDELLAEAFAKVESISFDIGILEKAKEISLVETAFPWDDVGTYNSLGAIIPPDDNGNIKSGNTILREVKNSVILGGDDLVAVIGVRDLAVVQDNGVVLVCPRKRVEEIKEIVALLIGENDKYL
ncbi:MAG: sugar phosphate nucleotidyltransferase, partial [Bacillota bacterium]|nr:sugar phosphate nucleotidyltransferase [Bacillota bacterium]